MNVPATHYAKVGEEHVAYQVVGDGPIDVLWQPGFHGHVEATWEHPRYERFLRQLASFSRLILFDKRGTGLSEPIPLTALPTLEEWMDDARAVLDAVGSERVALISADSSGPMTLLFGATYPERTSAIVLINTWARFMRADDYPWGAPPSVVDSAIEAIKSAWGTGVMGVTTKQPIDAETTAWWARYERQSATPRVAAAIFRMMLEVDVRHILGSINAPTLVLQAGATSFFRADHGHYLAEHIAGARFVEIPDTDEFFFVTQENDAFHAEIEEFLTGVRPIKEPDRVLATVLFTDLVGSTERAAELGDRRWAELLGRHREIVRRELAGHRGHEVNTAGDGFLATFDGPARAIHCAQAIADRTRQLGIDVRAGLHTGECELMGEDVGGIAVHIAARVASLAGAGEVLVSSTVKDLVAGSGIRFVERGTHALKGVPDEWRLYAVEG